MGSDNFFSKAASIDPLAQALNLPGAHKYAQSQAQDAAGGTDTNGGAYTGINATLAGANAGYAPGGPGATVGFAPTQPTPGNALFGHLQQGANFFGNATGGGVAAVPNRITGPSFSTGNPNVQQSIPQQNPQQNPYALAAGNAVRANQGGYYG